MAATSTVVDGPLLSKVRATVAAAVPANFTT